MKKPGIGTNGVFSDAKKGEREICAIRTKGFSLQKIDISAQKRILNGPLRKQFCLKLFDFPIKRNFKQIQEALKKARRHCAMLGRQFLSEGAEIPTCFKAG